MKKVKKFEIRRKEFDFAGAPVLDGRTAWYEAICIHGKSEIKHTHALDAAKEAAEMDYNSNCDERSAAVVCNYTSEKKPKGVISNQMGVSYRPRR